MKGIKTIDQQYYSVLGDEVRKKRKEKGYSIEYMAKQIGVTKQCYDYYELGLAKIKPKTWDKICEVLEIYPSIDIQIRIGL